MGVLLAPALCQIGLARAPPARKIQMEAVLLADSVTSVAAPSQPLAGQGVQHSIPFRSSHFYSPPVTVIHLTEMASFGCSIGLKPMPLVLAELKWLCSASQL